MFLYCNFSALAHTETKFDPFYALRAEGSGSAVTSGRSPTPTLFVRDTDKVYF